MKFRIFIAGLLFGCIFFFLFSGVAQSADFEITLFRVKIVADQFYRNKFASSDDNKKSGVGSENWKTDLTDLINRANQEFQSQGAKIKFEISGIAEWKIFEEKNITMRQALDDLVEKTPANDCDLVIGVAAYAFIEKDVGGYYWVRHILIRDYSSFFLKEEDWFRNNEESTTLSILLHEIGHFLGLEHSDNCKSLMHERVIGFRFLKEEIDLINKNAPELKIKKIAAPE